MNPMDLKRGIEAWPSSTVVKRQLEKNGPSPISTECGESSPGRHGLGERCETAIGEMIAQAMQKVGKEGVITVEEAKSP